MNQLKNYSTTLQPCIQKLTEIFSQNNVDDTHGIHHALIVVGHGMKAVQAVDNIGATQMQDIILACLLHDADDKKYFPKHSHYDNARKLLQEQGISQDRIDTIVGMISDVSFSKNGDTIDQSKPEIWYYPRYCDRIDAIGVKGIIRAYEYAQVVKNPVQCENTAKPVTLEQLAQVCNGRNQIYIKRGGKSESFIDHIYDKLYHLRLPQSIKNPYLVSKYEQGKHEIIEFVLRNARNNFETVEQDVSRLVKNEQERQSKTELLTI